MTAREFVPSLIRTYVPVLVAALFSWLTLAGFDTNEEAQVSVVTGLTFLLTVAYYGLARLLESKWPQFGVLLGYTGTPSYGAAAVTAEDGRGYEATEATPYPEGTPVDIVLEDSPKANNYPDNEVH